MSEYFKQVGRRSLAQINQDHGHRVTRVLDAESNRNKDLIKGNMEIIKFLEDQIKFLKKEGMGTVSGKEMISNAEREIKWRRRYIDSLKKDSGTGDAACDSQDCGMMGDAGFKNGTQVYLIYNGGQKPATALGPYGDDKTLIRLRDGSTRKVENEYLIPASKVYPEAKKLYGE